MTVGLVMLVFGADALVRGAAALARRVGISEFVVGVTVVAFGTSAPELFASGGAVLQDQSDIAIGNVIGSNIANILLILGAGAILSPIALHRSVRMLEIPVMAGITLAAWVMLLDGMVGRFEGASLVVGLALYIFFAIKRGSVDPSEDLPQVQGGPIRDMAYLLAGMVGLALGARALVDGSIVLARGAGVPEGIIGATIIAFGTSLPELAATVRAAMTGKSDIAIGNVIGSNVFNLLCVLGICSLLSPLAMPPEMNIHLHIMGGITLLLVLYALFRGMIGRRFGVIFVAGYLGYLGYQGYAIIAG
ncbi:MAG: calcium/sodium antiporter [Phycisphaerales bacterium]